MFIQKYDKIKLGNEDYFKLIMGQSPPSETYNAEGKGLPFLQGKAEFGDTYPNTTLFCSSPLKIAEKNDILISVRAPVGDVNIANAKSCIGRGISAIRPDSEKVDYLYLFYYLRKNENIFDSLSSGSTFKSIRTYELSNFEVLLPPLPVQRKIAEILGTADAAIEKVDQAISATERLKKGLMQQLLTKGIGHTQFKNTELGRIPKEWEVRKVKEIGEVVTGTTPSTQNEYYWGTDYQFVTPSDFNDDKYIYKTERYVTKKGFDVARSIPIHTVMVTCIASVGEVALPTKVCITNQQINSIICNKDIDVNYIYYLFIYLKSTLKRQAGITTSPIIKKSQFETFLLPIPKYQEQNKISRILTDFDDKIAYLKINRTGIINIKQSLMSDLLTGKRSVRV